MQGDIVVPPSDIQTKVKYLMIISQSCDLINGDVDSVALVPIFDLNEVESIIKQKKEEENEEKVKRLEKKLGELTEEKIRERRTLEKQIKDVSKGLLDSVKKKIKKIKEYDNKIFFYLPVNNICNTERAVKLDLILNLRKKDYEEILLRNRICSLNSPWREKLGWAVGNLFNRVAVDWKSLEK